ncbi:unnamed protein product [Prunus armeniaca]
MVHSPLVLPRILQSNSFDHLLERLRTDLVTVRAPTDYSKMNLGGKRIHLEILLLSTPLYCLWILLLCIPVSSRVGLPFVPTEYHLSSMIVANGLSSPAILIGTSFFGYSATFLIY